MPPGVPDFWMTALRNAMEDDTVGARQEQYRRTANLAHCA